MPAVWGIGSRKLWPLAFIGVMGSVPGSATRADVVPKLTKQGPVPQGPEAANGCAGRFPHGPAGHAQEHRRAGGRARPWKTCWLS